MRAEAVAMQDAEGAQAEAEAAVRLVVARTVATAAVTLAAGMLVEAATEGADWAKVEMAVAQKEVGANVVDGMEVHKGAEVAAAAVVATMAEVKLGA